MKTEWPVRRTGVMEGVSEVESTDVKNRIKQSDSWNHITEVN